MATAAICRELGWTYQEYLDQPEWLIVSIRAIMMAEDRYQEYQSRQAQRASANG